MSIQCRSANDSSPSAKYTPPPPPPVEENSQVFPTFGPEDEPGLGNLEWDGRSGAGAGKQRTVRRKKSSFDLRDVFKKGAAIPRSAMSML